MALARWQWVLLSRPPSQGGPHVGASMVPITPRAFQHPAWSGGVNQPPLAFYSPKPSDAACGTPRVLAVTYLSLLGRAPAVVCRPKDGLSPRAQPQPVAFRGSCTPGPAFAHQTWPCSRTQQRYSDRNGPEERLRLAVLQGGSHGGAAAADDSFPEGIVLESGFSEAR